MTEVSCAQSNSDKPRHLEGRDGREEIQSVGELSSKCEKLTDAQRVAEVNCAQSDGDKPSKLEGGKEKEDI